MPHVTSPRRALARLLPLALLCGSFASCRAQPGRPDEAPAELRGAGAARPLLSVEVTALQPGRGSSVVLGRAGDQRIALVADADTRTLHTIDVDEGRPLAVTHLVGAPSQIVLLPSGQVAVALRDRNRVELLDFGARLDEPLTPRASVEVPTEPVALAATDRELHVVSRWAAKLTVLALPPVGAPLEHLRDHPLASDPAAVVLSGGKAWVHHATGGVVEEIDLAPAGRVAPHRATGSAGTPDVPGFFGAGGSGTRAKPPVMGLSKKAPAGRVGTQGFALAATSDGRVFAPMVLAATSPPGEAVRVGYGGGVDGRPAMGAEVAVLSAGGFKQLRAVPDGHTGPTDCLLPRAASVDEKRELVLVACAGIDALVAYDASRKSPHDRAVFHAKVGKGPAGVAVDEARALAYVWSAFDGVLTTVDLEGRLVATHDDPDDPFVDASRTLASLPVRGPSTLPADVELGRRLFHDASASLRISSDGRACASCHPDGRSDGLTWSTQEGQRQTPMLVGRLEGTAPYGWNGDLSLEKHFERTLLRLGGKRLERKEREAIFAYVNALEAPWGKPADAASHDELVARGKRVFVSADAQCAQCHAGTVGTDGLTHGLASATALDTPSLKFLAQSAPYFHDGRYATLEELLDGSDGTMGHTRHLGVDDRKALLAFLRSL